MVKEQKSISGVSINRSSSLHFFKHSFENWLCVKGQDWFEQDWFIVNNL